VTYHRRAHRQRVSRVMALSDRSFLLMNSASHA
jgi:hypothetical protein